MDPFSDHPSSPDASLLQTKRRCPFGESPRDMKKPATEFGNRLPGNHARGALDYQDSGDSAFQILMQSQHSQPLVPSSNYTLFSKCWVCDKQSETMPCTFCERGVCEMCVRQCDKCFGVFCSFCATVKYDQHEDCALCLTCNAEDIKKRRAAPAVGQGRAQFVCERFPQATA